MGMASEIHHIVIVTVTPAVIHATLFNPSGGFVTKNKKKKVRPIIKPKNEIKFFFNTFIKLLN